MSISSNQPFVLNQLPTSLEFPDPARRSQQFVEVLTLCIKRISDSVNTKEGSLYLLQELGNFKQWYSSNPLNTRDVYRKVFDLVALNGGNIGAGATVAFPHGITNLTESVLIYAACTSTQPRFFSVMGPNNVWMDAININFTNPLGFDLTQADFVAEYVKEN